MPNSDDKPPRSAEIIDFTAYRNRDLIEVLESVLEDARAGNVSGAVMVLQRSRSNHGVVVVGSYENQIDKICDISGEIFLHFGPYRSNRPTTLD